MTEALSIYNDGCNPPDAFELEYFWRGKQAYNLMLKKTSITSSAVSSLTSHSDCEMRLQPFESSQRHLKNNNFTHLRVKIIHDSQRLPCWGENPYARSFKISLGVPEEMLLLPAWWIELQEHAAFRLSLSISAAQDTTVEMSATQNRDPPQKALSETG